jgi:hypothetical protein
MFASSQVYKFTCLQVYKIKKVTNYKLIIKILQHHKLQVHVCKFTSFQVYKFASNKINKNHKSQIIHYKVTNLQITIFQFFYIFNI